MRDIVGNAGNGSEVDEQPCVYSMFNGEVNVVYASVKHSSSDPGGGWFVVATKDVGDTLGTLAVDVIVVYGVVFVALVGGGHGGGRAVVQATNGGGTTAVGPQHRHSLLVTLVFVVYVSDVRLVTES